MVDFTTLFNAGIEAFCTHRRPKGVPLHGNHAQRRNRLDLQRAFANARFIYGTVGPCAFTRAGGQGGSLVSRAAFKLATYIRPAPNESPQDRALREVFIKMKEDLWRDRLYDPGARTDAYISEGYQMMDMYFGMQGNNGDQLFLNRDPVIGEFIHYAMGFHSGGRRSTDPLHAYDHGEPGWRAFERAFPGAGKGWQTCGATDSRYGAGWTATKMMSKIIREGIRRWGGTLVYEMKGVFGHNVFARNGWCGDADQELRDLLRDVDRQPTQAAGAYGRGRVEFHYSGRPTVPSKALFVANWAFSGQHMNNEHNRHNPEDRNESFHTYLVRLLQPNDVLIEDLWNSLVDIGPDRARSKGVLLARGMVSYIRDYQGVPNPAE